LVYTEETPSIALTWATQRQLPMENADEYSRNVRGILTKHCPSVQDWYSEQTNETSIEAIDEPEPAQEAFLEYVEDELVPRTRAYGVDFELAALLKSFRVDIEKSDSFHRVSSIGLETRLSVNRKT
jgi:hypothetical protein